MEDNDAGGSAQRPDSLLPYNAWTEDALRLVVKRALAHVAQTGLPGDHHFYLSFRTRAPGVSIPDRLLAQYPDEMTIVLQHQFWDLAVHEDMDSFSVGLSFNGVPATLVVPFAALVGFADPQAQFGLRFTPREDETADEIAEAEASDGALEAEQAPEEPQVVSLDAFRKRSPNKDS